MYAMHCAERYVQHPGNLLPSTVVKVTVTEYQLFVTVFKHINCRVDFFLEPYKVRDLFFHAPLNLVYLFKTSDEGSLCRTVRIVMGFKVTA